MRRRRTIAIVILAVILVGSLAANAVLWRRSTTYYAQANAERLDPLGLVARPASQPSERDGPTVVMWGDSRAAKWPQPPNTDVAWISAGISAQTTEQCRLRYEDHVSPEHPDVVIIQAGVNDLKTIALWPERRDQIVSRCIANLDAMATAAAAGGATVIMTSICPAGPVPVERRIFWSDETDAAIDEVNAAIRAMAGESVVVFDAHALLVDADGRLDPAVALDMLHLNEAGYARLNAELGPLLRELVVKGP